MSGEEGGGASRTTEPAAGTSTGTDVSLREYLGQMIHESRREFRVSIENLEKHFVEMHSHQEERFDDAMSGIDKRFDGVNEFRNALGDLSALMATKDSMTRVEEIFTAAARAMDNRIAAVEKRIDVREGQEAGSRLTKAGLYTALGITIASVGAFVILANYLTGH